MEHWPAPEWTKTVGFKHPKYRPGWVYRDGEVSHASCKPGWLLEHGDALFAAVPTVRSLLLLSVKDAELAALAERPWLGQIEHLGLVIGQGAPLSDLLGSPHLGALRSLDLNWTSNDPAYFPRDLPPKTLRPLLESPLLGQLRSLRTSVSSVKLLIELVAASRHVEQLGLRMQGGFADKDAARIGAAMEMPALRSLSIPNGVVPAHAPELRSLRLRGGGLPDGASFERLERLRLDQVFAPDLARSLDRALPNLSSLEIGSARPDQADACWSSVAAAELTALASLAIHNAPATPDALAGAARAELLARLRELSLTVTEPDQLDRVLDLPRLATLRVWWQGEASPRLGELAALERLAFGHRSGATGDAAIDAAFARPRPGLEQFAMATVHSQPSAGAAGLETLLDRAPESLRDVYLRLGKLPRKLANRVRDRFVVHDGTTKLTSPFAGMSDWSWPWLPSGPPIQAIDED